MFIMALNGKALTIREMEKTQKGGRQYCNGGEEDMFITGKNKKLCWEAFLYYMGYDRPQWRAGGYEAVPFNIPSPYNIPSPEFDKKYYIYSQYRDAPEGRTECAGPMTQIDAVHWLNDERQLHPRKAHFNREQVTLTVNSDGRLLVYTIQRGKDKR